MELINHYGCDPAVLFTGAEIRAELQRWGVAVPTRLQNEAEALYGRRLQMVSTGTVIIMSRVRSTTARLADCVRVRACVLRLWQAAYL